MKRARRWLREIVVGSSVAVVAWASVVVPLPLVEYIPGPANELAPLIAIEGVDVGELDGRTLMLTVRLRQQPPAQALMAAISDQRELYRVEQVYPPDLERDEYLRLQRDRFGRQFEVAAAVGARAAGYETEMVTEVVVVDVVTDSPADGVLQPGDVIESVDGTAVIAAEELQRDVRSRRVGDVIELTIQRGEDTQTHRVQLERAPEQDMPRLGVAIQTAVDELRLPFDIRLAEETRIGGPSAGMMFGLTVYDLLADEDLVGGRVIAGTGSLDADGTVGPVGGVAEKVRAAAREGADVVLVPDLQIEDARGAGVDIDIIGVETFDDVLAALRE
ncbi:MAG: PDZ domain-containing protein [Nitriliruptoraceae bacterium]